MTDEMWFDLSQEGKSIWNQNAPFWDDYIGEGNAFQLQLVRPATERLLALQPGERVLDIGCGNGNFSRRMAELGASVLAFDFSEAFIERARLRSQDQAGRIEYRVVDATNRDQLLALGRQSFDAAVASMVLMDMAAIEPLLDSLHELLKPDGRFVFSIMHPCFNTARITKVVEEVDREGQLLEEYSVKVSGYITPTVFKGLGIIGQPVPQYYFHRPLSVLFAHCFQAGFIIDGLEERAFTGEVQPNRPFSWINFHEIPPALVVRLRHACRT